MRDIIGYRLTVNRGARAGLVREYEPAQRTRARRFADRLDNDYGAICASVQPIFGFATTPCQIVAEHVAELAACGVAS